MAVFANYDVFFNYQSCAVASAFSFWSNFSIDCDTDCLIGCFISIKFDMR